jgi:polar amino acid transport system substrate-binding protein
MRLLFALLCCLAAPLRAQELQLSIIAQHSINERVWPAMEAAARRAGVKVVARPMSAERGVVQAVSGRIDGAVGRSMGVELKYPGLLRVSEPIYHYAPIAYSYRQIDMAGGWEGLRGHSICIRLGLQLTTARTKGMARQQLADEVSMLRMLKEGGCEIAVMDRNDPVARAAMASDPALLQLGPPLEEMPLFVYLHTRHAELAERLGRALREMRADGTMRRLGID